MRNGLKEQLAGSLTPQIKMRKAVVESFNFRTDIMLNDKIFKCLPALTSFTYKRKYVIFDYYITALFLTPTKKGENFFFKNFTPF